MQLSLLLLAFLSDFPKPTESSLLLASYLVKVLYPGNYNKDDFILEL